MFINLLRLAIEELPGNSHDREEDCGAIIAAAPHVTEKEAAVTTHDDLELRKLEEAYGELTEGKRIEVPLQELLSLLPRTRRRSDAYRSLAKKLEHLGVSLVIVTSKSKKDYGGRRNI
jgi:hypothetical protein